jgi:hypothetical protein
MVVLQVLRTLFPWRVWYQSSWMRRWMEKGVGRFKLLRANNPDWPPANVALLNKDQNPFETFDRNLVERSNRNNEFREDPSIEYLDGFRLRQNPGEVTSWDAVEIALQDLAELATAGSKKALFELPIEQLCGQMGVAMQQALDHPSDHVVLIVCISHLNEPADLANILAPLASILAPANTLTEGSPDKARVALYTAARQKISHRIQRAIDGFQISVGNRWKLILQLAATGIGVVAACIAIYIENESNAGSHSTISILSSGIAVGVLAGFIAPILRDLLSILDTVKK